MNVEMEAGVNTPIRDIDEAETGRTATARNNIEAEPTEIEITLPSREEIKELNDTMLNMNPFANMAHGILKAFGVNNDAVATNNAVQKYLRNPETFVKDDFETRMTLKDDFMRGLLNDLSFSALEDKKEYVEMNGSIKETAGSMVGMLARDIAIAVTTKVPMSITMGVDAGIQDYNHELAENPSEEKAVEYAVAHGTAMTLGYATGLKLMPKVLGLAMKNSFSESIAGSAIKGGMEMIGWTGAEHYADRAMKNGIDIAYGDPQLFSNVAALEKSAKYVALKEQIGSEKDYGVKIQMTKMYNKAFMKDLFAMRSDEEPIDAWTAGSMFVFGALLHATPRAASKAVSKLHKVAKIPVEAVENRLPDALTNIIHFPSIKFNSSAVVDLEGSELKNLAKEVREKAQKGMTDEQAVADVWYGLNKGLHSKKNYRKLMRILNLRVGK